jgi:hypothetical protein
MSLMLAQLYDALRAAGAPEEAARKAAEEVAGFDKDIGGLRTEIRVVQAFCGLIFVVLLGVLWQLLALNGQVAGLDARLAGIEARLAAPAPSGATTSHGGATLTRR